jgi:[acyl-carrier-protein] S-malonyltransferase
MGCGRVAVGGVVRIAVVFPGQGSQGVGMGCDIAAHSSAARGIFDRAAAVLGYDLLALQRDGSEETLRETEVSQPAIFTTNLALYAVAGGAFEPVVTAGHSFAELCSLVIAESLSFDEALRIVSERGKAMQAAAQRARGGMSAILGLEAAQVRDVLAGLGRRGRVALANFNSPTQIVISGDFDAVQAAAQAMLDAGAKRVVPLNVSGAWHSELMEPAVEPLRAAVEASHFALPVFDVISNVDGRPYRDVATIKANLIRSVVDEVRWHATAERLLSYEPDMVVEFGASGVLSALFKRMTEYPERARRTLIVSDSAALAKLHDAIAEQAAASA